MRGHLNEFKSALGYDTTLFFNDAPGNPQNCDNALAQLKARLALYDEYLNDNRFV